MSISPTMPSSRSTLPHTTGWHWLLIGIAVAVLVAAAWYWFRPELLFVNKTVNEGLPAAGGATPASVDQGAAALSSGTFHSVAHETKGTATIFKLADGREMVRLTGFQTSNGPDVHVDLVAVPDALDSATVTKADRLDLGTMKGNIGDQNYDIPKGTNLAKYPAVTIWCKRFDVNFGTAPLKAK